MGEKVPGTRDLGHSPVPSHVIRSDVGTKVPTEVTDSGRTMRIMSMYVDLLSQALGGGVTGLSGPALVDYARACRAAIEEPGSYGERKGLDLLVAEVTYDRVLVRLCELKGIAVDASWFVYPYEARQRLENDLAMSGVELRETRRSD